MNVMYLCNDSYAMIAGVSVYSLLDNNSDVDEINIFLVTEDIESDNLKKLQEIVELFHRNIFLSLNPIWQIYWAVTLKCIGGLKMFFQEFSWVKS